MDHIPLSPFFRQRAVPGSIAAIGFATLYVASPLFAMDINIAGLHQETIHNAGHFLVYGTLSVLLLKAFGNRYLWAWLASLALATGEESYQSLIPGRVPSLEDALLNLIAISFFLCLASLFDPTDHKPTQATTAPPPLPTATNPLLKTGLTRNNPLPRQPAYSKQSRIDIE